ncbi:hypothetical protein MRX96_011091 [Rhipicephalus microplus]
MASTVANISTRLDAVEKQAASLELCQLDQAGADVPRSKGGPVASQPFRHLSSTPQLNPRTEAEKRGEPTSEEFPARVQHTLSSGCEDSGRPEKSSSAKQSQEELGDRHDSTLNWSFSPTTSEVGTAEGRSHLFPQPQVHKWSQETSPKNRLSESAVAGTQQDKNLSTSSQEEREASKRNSLSSQTSSSWEHTTPTSSSSADPSVDIHPEKRCLTSSLFSCSPMVSDEVMPSQEAAARPTWSLLPTWEPSLPRQPLLLPQLQLKQTNGLTQRVRPALEKGNSASLRTLLEKVASRVVSCARWLEATRLLSLRFLPPAPLLAQPSELRLYPLHYVTHRIRKRNKMIPPSRSATNTAVPRPLP